jgi:hypothetical protein
MRPWSRLHLTVSHSRQTMRPCTQSKKNFSERLQIAPWPWDHGVCHVWLFHSSRQTVTLLSLFKYLPDHETRSQLRLSWLFQKKPLGVDYTVRFGRRLSCTANRLLQRHATLVCDKKRLLTCKSGRRPSFVCVLPCVFMLPTCVHALARDKNGIKRRAQRRTWKTDTLSHIKDGHNVTFSVIGWDYSLTPISHRMPFRQTVGRTWKTPSKTHRVIDPLSTICTNHFKLFLLTGVVSLGREAYLDPN